MSHVVEMAEMPASITEAKLAAVLVRGFSMVARDADNPSDYAAIIVDVGGMAGPLEVDCEKVADFIQCWRARRSDYAVLSRDSVGAVWSLRGFTEGEHDAMRVVEALARATGE